MKKKEAIVKEDISLKTADGLIVTAEIAELLNKSKVPLFLAKPLCNHL